MGSVIKARCDCGFEREMLLGGGMRNSTTHCNFPLYCKECRAFLEGNLLKKGLVCPKCKSADVVPYDDANLCSRKGDLVFNWNLEDQVGRHLVLTDGDYVCPKCGKFTLSFMDVGRWD